MNQNLHGTLARRTTLSTMIFTNRSYRCPLATLKMCTFPSSSFTCSSSRIPSNCSMLFTTTVSFLAAFAAFAAAFAAASAAIARRFSLAEGTVCLSSRSLMLSRPGRFCTRSGTKAPVMLRRTTRCATAALAMAARTAASLPSYGVPSGRTTKRSSERPARMRRSHSPGAAFSWK